jgi:hypothetical protein
MDRANHVESIAENVFARPSIAAAFAALWRNRDRGFA